MIGELEQSIPWYSVHKVAFSITELIFAGRKVEAGIDGMGLGVRLWLLLFVLVVVLFKLLAYD